MKDILLERRRRRRGLVFLIVNDYYTYDGVCKKKARIQYVVRSVF